MILECGGLVQRDAALVDDDPSFGPKRRRRFALPAHSKRVEMSTVPLKDSNQRHSHHDLRPRRRENGRPLSIRG